MPSPIERATALWSRIRSVFSSAPRDPVAAARWPHLRRGWLDPDVLLQGWRTTVDVRDLDDAVRAIASASGGRLGEAEVTEIVDVARAAGPGDARALRFGRPGPNAFRQIWTGLVRSDAGSVKIFLLGDQSFVDAAAAALSVSGFGGAEKRAEYDLLRSFFLAAWDWRWTEGPERLRARMPSGADPRRLREQMERILADPSSPFLEALRGLRGRVEEIVAKTRSLEPTELERADAFLAGRGAPTLTEMRRRLDGAPAGPR